VSNGKLWSVGPVTENTSLQGVQQVPFPHMKKEGESACFNYNSTMDLKSKKTYNVGINLILRRVRVTFLLWKSIKYYIF
jgi:hypothetical protein